MIFKSIRIKNFRQYSNEIKINFSIPVENQGNITLIMAENGVGKTTLLQSVRYCFFGSRSNYLRLPNKSELINNNLINTLKELDETEMFVEVEFEHEGKNYISRREQKFEKRNNRINEIGEEIFSLKESNEFSGFQTIAPEHAIFKMRNIMPEGLSYIFMFDGERMERNIGDREFKNDLKESILGMLDIKQYEELINLLGNKGLSTSVIGKINNQKKGETFKENETVNKHNRLLEQTEEMKGKVFDLEGKLTKIDIEIKSNEELQKKYNDLEKEQEKLKKYNLELEYKSNEINQKSKELSLKNIWRLKDILISNFNNAYYEFRLKTGENSIIYKNLHIDTLDSILTNNICLCGEDISDNNKKIKHIEKLKDIALPFEIGHHLNTINEELEKSKESLEINYSQDNEEILNLKLDEEEINTKIVKQEEKMTTIEKKYNIDYSKQIIKLRDERDQIIKEIQDQNTYIENFEKQIKRGENEIGRIDSNNEKNLKINKMVNELEQIKIHLENKLNDLNRHARKTLETHFQNSISKVLQSKYTARIDEEYNIEIYNENNYEITESLSTGQNVVISLSMINALIETSKEISLNSKDERYGIIMDAALSNLDETHIYRVTKHNLLNIDQLIFLSFKKQLRDEMIDGIYDNVGKAYELSISEKNQGIIQKEIDVKEIKDYISNNRGD